MKTIMMISQVLLCLLAAVVVWSVLMQKPSDGSIGSSFGQGSSGKAMKSHTAEARLNTITKYGAIVVLSVSLALVIMQRFV